jgi:ankyrin repeat protein
LALALREVELAHLINENVSLNVLFDYPLQTDLFGRGALKSIGDPDYWQAYPDSLITPLIFALHCKDFEVVKKLLLAGANPNATDGGSLTPLIHAVKLVSGIGFLSFITFFIHCISSKIHIVFTFCFEIANTTDLFSLKIDTSTCSQGGFDLI